MRSELPVVASTRHHWIVLIRLPDEWVVIALVVMLVLAAVWPWPWMVLLVGTLAVGGVFRFRTWRAEVIILTQKRIVRMQGIPETTTSEASLRFDRIFGARLVQTVPGKLLDYGTIELEAPGDHPAVRHLNRIAAPNHFYAQLRALIFNDRLRNAPAESSESGGSGDAGREYSTEPLPRIPSTPPPTGE